MAMAYNTLTSFVGIDFSLVATRLELVSYFFMIITPNKLIDLATDKESVKFKRVIGASERGQLVVVAASGHVSWLVAAKWRLCAQSQQGSLRVCYVREHRNGLVGLCSTEHPKFTIIP